MTMKLLFAHLVVLLSLVAVSSGIQFYVSLNGNDAWSGTLPSPNAAKTDGPFQTLKRAQQASRQYAAKTPVRVSIEEGTHFLSDTLYFTPEDSGSETNPIVYDAYPSKTCNAQRPIISAGLRITNWKKGENGVWTSKVPFGTQDFHQLFVNGERRVRARIPSLGQYLYWDQPLKGEQAHWGFTYKGDDIRNFHNLEDVNVQVYQAWTASRHFISKLIPSNRTVIFSTRTGFPIGQWANTAGKKRYILDNVLEGLDEPGEWYYDRKSQIVSYIPLANEDPNQLEIIVPQRRQILNFQGTTTSLVSYIQFNGLSFQHADWNCTFTENCDGQIAHVGDYAVWFQNGCHNNSIESCDLNDLGTGGVRIGDASKQEGVMWSTYNRVNNSYINRGGYVFPEGIGVLIQQSSYNQVTHNDIGNFSYTGVSVGWDWEYNPTKATNNYVAFNEIHDIGRHELSDMGGIYTLGESPGTHIYNNLIHRIYTFDYGAWGLYPDQASSRITYENNIVFDTKSSGLHQHFGMNNSITNNIFAFGDEETNDGELRTDPDPGQPNSFEFTRNIVVVNNGSLFYGNWKTSTNPLRTYSFDYNVYWSSPKTAMVFPEGKTFQQWQQMNEDVHSVIADPLFVDPSKRNFTLQPGSPALKLGFKPINTQIIGPQRSASCVH